MSEELKKATEFSDCWDNENFRAGCYFGFLAVLSHLDSWKEFYLHNEENLPIPEEERYNLHLGAGFEDIYDALTNKVREGCAIFDEYEFLKKYILQNKLKHIIWD